MENNLTLYEDDQEFKPYLGHTPSGMLVCPLCKSDRIETGHIATKLGGTIGTIAGAGVSIASSISGARAGAAVGALGGPFGMAVGGVAGAILGALASGAAGCTTGIALGQIVDRTVLDNHVCKDCGHTFTG